jgi:hypothetical protein
MHKSIDCLSASLLVSPISQLPGVSPQSVPQRPPDNIQMSTGLGLVDSKRLQRLPRTHLGHVTRFDNGAFQVTSKVCWQSWHSRDEDESGS